MEKKKSLGQHFLRSSSALAAIREAVNPTADDLIVEIGPGEGALTRELLPQAGKIIAIEKDHRLIPLLKEQFAKEVEAGTLEAIEEDALAFDPSTLNRHDLRRFTYKLAGNIPYYITGALLEKFLTASLQPSMLVFLIQKEVAERIARSKKESLLSLSVKAYGEPAYVQTVPAGAFSPPPRVDSAILLVSNISRKNFMNPAHEKRFFELLHAGFAHKRKLLLRNLEPVLGERAGQALDEAGISPTARAEDVGLQQWLELARFNLK